MRAASPPTGSRCSVVGRTATIATALRATGTAKGTVWLYFSGHGAASVTGERLLLGNDVKAELSSLQNRGLPVGEVDGLVGGGPARIVKVLDTCYVGVGRTGQDLLPGQRFAVPAAAVGVGSVRVLEWAAAAPNEASGPFTPAEHGAFTYFALGALRGWADGELDGQRDGAVTVDAAKAYVLRATRVAQIRDQHAQLNGGAPEWVLAAHAPEAAPQDRAFVGLTAPVPVPAAPSATAATGAVRAPWGWQVADLYPAQVVEVYGRFARVRRAHGGGTLPEVYIDVTQLDPPLAPGTEPLDGCVLAVGAGC